MTDSPSYTGKSNVFYALKTTCRDPHQPLEHASSSHFSWQKYMLNAADIRQDRWSKMTGEDNLAYAQSWSRLGKIPPSAVKAGLHCTLQVHQLFLVRIESG